jgi:hypothetical protein
MTDTLFWARWPTPEGVTIWEGFRVLRRPGLPFDFILYSNYERQVEAQFAGQIHVAWYSSLAWLRAEAIARHRGVTGDVRAIAMRDTDCDLTSVIVVRADSGIHSIADLRGKRLGVGAIDSPQATLIPLQWLREQGIKPETDVTVVRHDVLGGKHGDHVGGERDAARALAEGVIDAACMIDGNHLLFTQEGTLPAGRSTVIGRTPAFDHCNFTTSPAHRRTAGSLRTTRDGHVVRRPAGASVAESWKACANGGPAAPAGTACWRAPSAPRASTTREATSVLPNTDIEALRSATHARPWRAGAGPGAHVLVAHALRVRAPGSPCACRAATRNSAFTSAAGAVSAAWRSTRPTARTGSPPVQATPSAGEARRARAPQI